MLALAPNDIEIEDCASAVGNRTEIVHERPVWDWTDRALDNIAHHANFGGFLEPHQNVSAGLCAREQIALEEAGPIRCSRSVRHDRPDYDFTRELELQICEVEDGATLECIVHSQAGAGRVRFTCTRQGTRALLRAEGVSGPGPNVSVRGGASGKVSWPDAARELSIELSSANATQRINR